MAKFSERYGYKTARETIQIDSMSVELSNSLWSLLKLHVWDRVYWYRSSSYLSDNNPGIKTLCERLWFGHFKKPLDTLGDDWSKIFSGLRKYFFECEWYEVYDFVEFIADNFPYSGRKEFIEACNATLEKEVSAYRFVNGLISRITDETEIAEIDRALEGPRDPFARTCDER